MASIIFDIITKENKLNLEQDNILSEKLCERILNLSKYDDYILTKLSEGYDKIDQKDIILIKENNSLLDNSKIFNILNSVGHNLFSQKYIDTVLPCHLFICLYSNFLERVEKSKKTDKLNILKMFKNISNNIVDKYIKDQVKRQQIKKNLYDNELKNIESEELYKLIKTYNEYLDKNIDILDIIFYILHE